MLAKKQNLVRNTIQAGTGAEIDIEVSAAGVQAGLSIWFSDIGRPRSPIVVLRPFGLKRHLVELSFGPFAGQTIEQMERASTEEKQLARALIQSTSEAADISISGEHSLGDWVVDSANFSISVERRNIDEPNSDEAIVETCYEFVTPLLAAMAELYGYDVIDEHEEEYEGAMEGAVAVVEVRRRERNPRNRLLCLRIHGEVCGVCGLDPKTVYGQAGSIIEVHHIQPLSTSDVPQHYDPMTDLIPLCPSCHRAAHTKRLLPWSPVELQELISDNVSV